MRGAQRAVAWCASALLAIVLVAFPGPVAATAAPHPTPALTPATAPKTEKPGLHVSVSLGSVHVNLNVPLDVGSLLGGATKQPIVPPTAPPPRTAPTRARPTRAAPTGRAASHRAAVPDHRPAAGRVVSAYPPTPPHVSHPAPRPPRHRTTPAKHPRRHVHHHRKGSSAPDGRVIFATGNISGSGAVALVLLCIACGIGVAIVVRLSGGRRRL